MVWCWSNIPARLTMIIPRSSIFHPIMFFVLPLFLSSKVAASLWPSAFVRCYRIQWLQAPQVQQYFIWFHFLLDFCNLFLEDTGCWVIAICCNIKCCIIAICCCMVRRVMSEVVDALMEIIAEAVVGREEVLGAQVSTLDGSYPTWWSCVAAKTWYNSSWTMLATVSQLNVSWHENVAWR